MSTLFVLPSSLADWRVESGDAVLLGHASQ